MHFYPVESMNKETDLRIILGDRFIITDVMFLTSVSLACQNVHGDYDESGLLKRFHFMAGWPESETQPQVS